MNNTIPSPRSFTKRSVLSTIAQVLGPLGWVAPITVGTKILMQDLWILKSDWDSPLPPHIHHRWSDYLNSVNSVATLAIDRWLGTIPNSECEIHGFADASSRAYAAAVYLKVQQADNGSRISLLIAKTKVSPIKTMSIPNLELNAAALLVKLMSYIKRLPIFKDVKVHAW